MRTLTFLLLIGSFACGKPQKYHYTRITQQGASWYSNECITRLDSALVLNSETAELVDTFRGVWYDVEHVQTFKGTYPPIVTMIAPDGAMIIWPDGMVSRLTRNP